MSLKNISLPSLSIPGFTVEEKEMCSCEIIWEVTF